MHDVHVVTPKCGLTVCDNSDVAKSYAANWILRRQKTIRYRVVNVYDDDGANPAVTEEQINYQHEQLNAAFRRHNITWDLTVVSVLNSSLQSRTILFDCTADTIGDGRCDDQCKHGQTGNDGGDCDTKKTTCQKAQMGNGHCDDECNRYYHGWDGGDCCRPGPFGSSSSRCFDPMSPYRTYMHVNEYKSILGLDSTTHLNVYFASWTAQRLQGIATFPWEKTVFDVLGGVVLQPSHYGKPGKVDSTIHEFGHVLGLWHVHHGISEMECNDECLELHPSLELGDMVEDTAPTPFNTYCRDPEPCEYDKCGLETVYRNTPYTNYMSYADDDCTNSFTPQQGARMHCYIDLMYKPWENDRAPSSVPMAPTIISVHKPSSTIVLAWVPPLSGNLGGPDSDCNQCLNDNTLQQYASTAYSPNPSRDQGFWDPKQALGPPDAESCDASTKAWMPDPVDGVCDDCYIELGFNIPVIPVQLSLWVAWYPTNGVKDMVLVFTDGLEKSLGEIDVYCDMPYTTRLNVNKRVSKVRVHIKKPFVSIDAVQITSEPNNPVCQPCEPLKYTVHRTPAFPSGENTVTVETPRYADSDVVSGPEYVYRIEAVQGSKSSDLSPPLVYQHGHTFCGDGIIDR
ncbi:pappalysin-1-like [Ptychodera flava]|uniref:pappalysin-1-like n=1 Tax=Ptychodera flava TaxID=63121 RepID=UPI00396A7FD2